MLTTKVVYVGLHSIHVSGLFLQRSVLVLLRPRHCEPVSKEWTVFSRPRRWLEYYELTSLIPSLRVPGGVYSLGKTSINKLTEECRSTLTYLDKPAK
jgi:hypothetical protein